MTVLIGAALAHAEQGIVGAFEHRLQLAQYDGARGGLDCLDDRVLRRWRGRRELGLWRIVPVEGSKQAVHGSAHRGILLEGQTALRSRPVECRAVGEQVEQYRPLNDSALPKFLFCFNFRSISPDSPTSGFFDRIL